MKTTIRIVAFILVTLLLLLAGCNLQKSNGEGEAPDGPPQTPSMPRFEGAPVALPVHKTDANRPLPDVQIPGAAQSQGQGVQSQALPANRVGLRILVIGPTAEDAGLQAWRAILGQLGANYEVLLAATQELTSSVLEDASGGRFLYTAGTFSKATPAPSAL